VLAVIEALAAENAEGFEIHGVGSAGPIALHAAAFEPRIKQVVLERSVISWSAVVRTPLSYNQLTNAVPGALAAYDLPDLAAALAPRRLTIRAAVDPQGEVVAQNVVKDIYAACLAAYQQAKAEKACVLEN
jgi:hypothetical protein